MTMESASPTGKLRKLGQISRRHCHSPSTPSTSTTPSIPSVSSATSTSTHFSWPSHHSTSPQTETPLTPPTEFPCRPPPTSGLETTPPTTSVLPPSTTPSSTAAAAQLLPPSPITPPPPPPTPLSDSEFTRILSARSRLAHRSRELESLVHIANQEMDLVRRKLCKDLEVMECLKEEIDKAGQGGMRERLEEDFHHEYIAYVATLVAQKEKVEEMQRRKQIAIRELEGIQWSDQVLEERIEDFRDTN